MKIAIFAAGTGGHIFPAISIAEQFKHDEVIFFASSRNLEKEIYAKTNFKVIHLELDGFRGKSLIKKLLWPIQAIKCLMIALSEAKKEKVKNILLMGGYISIIGLLMSKFHKANLFIHEQNSILGSANKLALKSAVKVFTAHKIGLKNEVTTGNPVRSNFKDSSYILNKKRNKILVLGGSQGSKYFTDTIAEALAAALPDHDIIFQKGSNEISFETKRIKYLEFIDDIKGIFEETKFIVCRSGASTVAEVQSYGMPAIFIPLKNSIDDHQNHNAINACADGGGIIIQEGETTLELIKIIKDFASKDFEQLSKKMKKDIHFQSATKIHNEIKQN